MSTYSATQPLYLDYHATTPVDPRVLDEMLPFFTERFGNAASRNHAFGWAARGAVDTARQQVAALIGARHADIVFTSGATESNNIAIAGVARAHGTAPRHVVTVATEHSSVLDTCRALEREGCRVTVLGVRPDGLLDLESFVDALSPDTVVVSVMAANNETGVLMPIDALSVLTRERGIALHVDASQAIGKVPFDVLALGVDLVSFTAHKIYGPKGIGALFVRRREGLSVDAIQHGGGHERGLRPGTLNVPGIVGLGKAAEIAGAELAREATRLGAMRDRLRDGLVARIPGLRINGSMEHRLPQNLNVSVAGVDGEALALAMDDMAVSSGPACSSAKTTPSHVLTALGLDPDLARASIRFGLGRWTTDADIDFAIDKVASVVTRLRQARAPGSR